MDLEELTRLEVLTVWDRGVPHRERVAIRVLDTCNLGRYLLLRGTRVGSKVTFSNSDALWFPDHLVHEGTMVIVFTGPGEFRQSRMKETGAPAFVYHWDRPTVIFEEQLSVPVLIRANGIHYPTMNPRLFLNR